MKYVFLFGKTNGREVKPVNMIGIPPRRNRKKRAGVWLLSLLLAVSLLFGGLYAYQLYEEMLENRPNTERIGLDFSGVSQPIFYAGEQQEYSALGEAESLKLPFGLVQELIDPAIFYEEATQSVIITTSDKVIRMQTDQLTAVVNEVPMDLRFPVEDVDGQIYLPIHPLIDLYGIELRESAETDAVLLYKQAELIQWGEIIGHAETLEEPIAMRTKATIKAPIAADLSAGDQVVILNEESNGWYHLQLPSGYKGYVDKQQVRISHIETIPEKSQERVNVPWKPLGGKINLTWEHVVSRNPNTDNIGEMPGLNVISPTWFHLKEDREGELYIQNLADPGYVQWAHDRGYQVWGLFSNDFDPDLTSKALSTYDNRMLMIKQITALAQMYNLQGINIDFENVYLRDKDYFTQFVREMAPFLHEQGLVVSIDVTIRGGSEMWSLFADRREIGKVVDYMIVMTYDEHWGSSPIAGSVASLPWVEKGMVDIIQYDDVPASKLILGVPFYTREWYEEHVDGQLKVTSSARFMQTIKNTIAERNLTPEFLEDIGQHYVEFHEGDVRHRIWIEDAISMRSRIELVNKHELAGVASWRRGFETPEIWDVINETLEQHP